MSDKTPNTPRDFTASEREALTNIGRAWAAAKMPFDKWPALHAAVVDELRAVEARHRPDETAPPFSIEKGVERLHEKYGNGWDTFRTALLFEFAAQRNQLQLKHHELRLELHEKSEAEMNRLRSDLERAHAALNARIDEGAPAEELRAVAEVERLRAAIEEAHAALREAEDVARFKLGADVDYRMAQSRLATQRARDALEKALRS